MTAWPISAAAALVLGLAFSTIPPAVPTVEAASPSAPVSVTMVATLTAPQRGTGFIESSLLATYTSPFGLLTRALNQVIDRPVAIGVDPSIIASIRVLGSSAPESAVAWLERLEAATNETFPLSWADSDLTLALQAGEGEVLQPESFDFAINPSLFAPAEEEPAVNESDDPVDTPAPTQTDEADDDLPPLPTSESLVAWDYTIPSLAWPAMNSVTAHDLATLTRSHDAVLLSSENLGSGHAWQALASVGETTSLVSDATLSAAFNATVESDSGNEWSTAMTTLASSVAATPSTVDRPASLLLAVDRSVQTSDVDLGLTISTLAAAANVRIAGLEELLGGIPVSANIVDPVVDETVVSVVAGLLREEDADRAFAVIAQDPSLITAERRLDLLATLSNAWGRGSSRWLSAADTYTEASADLRNSVRIVKSSSITLWADRGSLPVTVSNELDQPVTVYITVSPRTALLKVENPFVQLTIAPRSQSKGAVPVESLSNGIVVLDVTVHSVTGKPIGEETTVRTTVQAGWETPFTVAFAVLLVLVFAVGILRAILRRRRMRQSEG